METTAKGENNIPYDGGLGTRGKFRKQQPRRYHTKPYDRPAARVSRILDRNYGGWLSTLVDPVQRIITHIARSLFASVSRKLVTPAESNLQPSEQRLHLPGTCEGHKEGSAPIDQINMRNENGSTTLEKILQHKTFSRPQVDRLTTSLRERAIDSSTKNHEQSNRTISRTPPSHENNLVSALPLGSQKPLHECIASPAELAKAYMGSKSSQVVKEDSVFLNNSPCPPKPSTISLLPRQWICHPKSRRRFAANTMATTPYSMPHEYTLKINCSCLPSSQSTPQESLPSGSKRGDQKGLKRISSVLDNELGSLVPVRRIRQKSTNLSSRSLRLPASDSALSVRRSGVGLDARHASSCKFANTSVRSTEDEPGSSFKLFPSKSTEIASKISQLLDKMVTAKEKASKLSSSKQHCPALNSLHNVKAPKLLDNAQEKRAASRGSGYQKQEKPKESGFHRVFGSA